MFNTYPYTDTHELNLDWIIRKMKELNIKFDEFKVINQITFSGAWDITKNYPAWTIVSDNNIGYVSIQPVPAGVLLTNADYWREVIDYTAQIAGLQNRVVILENDMTQAQTDITNIKKAEYTVINVVEYGADNTGTNDNASLINDLFDNNPGCTFYFEPGTYLFDSGLLINHSCKIILSPKAILKANAAFSVLFTLDNDGQREDYISVFGMKKIDIQGGILDGNNLCDVGIEHNAAVMSHLEDMKLINFSDIGIHVQGGAYFNADQCQIFGVDNNSNYGIKDDGYDNLTKNCMVVNCDTAFYANNDRYESCTAWIDERGDYDCCAFENRSRSTYVNCVADTVKIAWKGVGNSNTILANCEVMNNDGVATPTPATLVFDTTDAQAKYEYINLTVVLSSFTFAANLDAVSGINLIGSTGVNMPRLLKFNQIKVPRGYSTNIDAATAATFLETENYSGYFLANAVGNTSAGIGNLNVIRSGIFVTQTAIVAGQPIKSRLSSDSGSTWSTWT